MSHKKMHDHEIDIDMPLVKQLMDTQFPKWAHLPVKAVQSMGTDNTIYRLGVDMCVRLPRIPDAVKNIKTEQKWLSRLGAHLPLAIPSLLEKGQPDVHFPWPWSINRWLEGDNAFNQPIDDLPQAAMDLAHFLRTFQQIDCTAGPPSRRGGPLSARDNATRAAIESLHAMVDTKAVTTCWQQSLRAPAWDKPLVWTHGDLLPANLLVKDGRLTAVIDFGCLGIGDPACDLIAAWSIFTHDTRGIFRAILGVDDATWIRGRGWALSIAVIILPYYHTRNPELATVAKRMIDELLSGG